MINGYIPVGFNISSSDASSLFYTLFTKKNETIQDFSPQTPILFWFDGGPGCSSQWQFWDSIGALQYDSESQQIQIRNYSWNDFAHIVFVDQPLGTSFSYNNNSNQNITTTQQAGECILQFFDQFYTTFPNLTASPTYFMGESYGGHWVPYFGEVFQKEFGSKVNFQGVGIGDGWTDASLQGQNFDTMYFSVGIASSAQKEDIIRQQLQVLEYFQENNYDAATILLDNLSYNDGFVKSYGGVTASNFQNYYGEEEVNNYNSELLLNNSDFRSNVYGIPGFIPDYQADCNDTIAVDFQADISVSFKSSIEYLLSQDGIKVLIYNGQMDLMCNTPGQLAMVNNFRWVNLQQWQSLEKKLFTLQNQKVVGNYKANDQFCFTVIYGAGHQVPYDQPVSAYYMFQKLLNWDWQ